MKNTFFVFTLFIVFLLASCKSNEATTEASKKAELEKDVPKDNLDDLLSKARQESRNLDDLQYKLMKSLESKTQDSKAKSLEYATLLNVSKQRLDTLLSQLKDYSEIKAEYNDLKTRYDEKSAQIDDMAITIDKLKKEVDKKDKEIYTRDNDKKKLKDSLKTSRDSVYFLSASQIFLKTFTNMIEKLKEERTIAKEAPKKTECDCFSTAYHTALEIEAYAKNNLLLLETSNYTLEEVMTLSKGILNLAKEDMGKNQYKKCFENVIINLKNQ